MENKIKDNQRLRSPRYPSMPLREAVELAQKIYSKDGMNPLDRESAALHAGYNGINGASATALATLKQFGLISDSGPGMIRLTELALDILEPTDDPAKLMAVLRSAFTPDLFSSLRDRFPEKVPSEANLRAHLIRQRFTPAAVKASVPAYLATCEYLLTLGVPLSSDADPVRVDLNGKDDTAEPKSTPLSTSLALLGSASGKLAEPALNVRRMVFDTEEGEAIFTFPEALSEASVDDIEQWFALVLKRLRRSTKA